MGAAVARWAVIPRWGGRQIGRILRAMLIGHRNHGESRVPLLDKGFSAANYSVAPRSILDRCDCQQVICRGRRGGRMAFADAILRFPPFLICRPRCGLAAAVVVAIARYLASLDAWLLEVV